jgi:UPF0716 protein FxsA
MRLSHLLFLTFIAVPIFEIYLLVSVGQVIGAWYTIGLVILTAVIGTWLLRLQGIRILQQVQQQMNAGEVPALQLLEGMLLLIAGALLLTPGFFTDAIGFACLVPGFRRMLAQTLARALLGRVQVHGHYHETQSPSGPTTLEGEFRREDKHG